MAAANNDPLQALLASGAVESGPFAANSRYRGVPLAQMKRPDGTVLAYLRRRFVPQPAALATLGRYQVQQGDRPDSIAARLLGDPEQWWRLADANRTIDPQELTETIGRWLRVGAPAGADGSGGGS